MAPVFFADPLDLRLRTEEEAFLLGNDLLVIPAFAENPTIPFGIWEEVNLVAGEKSDKYQAELKIRGGSIIPAGKVIQNTNEESFDPLTLFVCLDETGKAEGELYWDAGDGWAFECGDFSLMKFAAQKDGNTVNVYLESITGDRKIDKEIGKINVELIQGGKVYRGSGSLEKGVTVLTAN
jgi:alpha-glucosidase